MTQIRKHLQSAKAWFGSEGSSQQQPYNARSASHPPPTHLWAAIADQQVPPRRVSVMKPASFDDAQALADRFKRQQPVILNLQQADSELSRRMVDFCAGLTYALDGRIQTVTSGLFLLTPHNVEVWAKESKRLAERAFFNQL